jgi:hypothetical protein
MRSTPNLATQLPPYLQEACAILATGLVRLRRHTAEDVARDAAVAQEFQESSLRVVARQSGYAKPRDKERA